LVSGAGLVMKDFNKYLERFLRGIFPVDYLILIYSAVMLIISIVFYRELGKPLLFLGVNLTFIYLLLYLIYFEERRFDSVHYWIHTWLPILTFIFYYTQSTSFDNLIFRHTFDPILQRWEHHLFNVPLNRIMAPYINNLFADEMMHFFYFSYYLIIFVPGIIMFLNRYKKTHEMLFSLTFMMYFHYLVFMIFPGDGPVFERPQIFTRGVLFIPILDFIYKFFGDQGGGAFPSTHVTTSVIVFLYSFESFKSRSWPIYLTAIGITIATVYCSYHYAVDAIAGIVSGTLFYFIGKYLYSIWDHHAELPAE
jgi:membrane-associated phospholipid phosphatase